MQLVAVHFIPRLFAHCLSWAGQLGPSILRVRHRVWSSQQPCQIDKVLQMRKRAQGKVTCPGTHSSWMVGLGSNPQSSDFSSLGNDSTTPGWLSPHPTCSALIVANHTSTSPGFAKPLWIKGICPLLSLTKKVLIYVAGSDCACVCRFYMRVEFFYSKQSSQQHYERHTISHVIYRWEKWGSGRFTDRSAVPARKFSDF